MSVSIIWQKSSFSGGSDGNNCVEVGIPAGISAPAIHLRESEVPDTVVITTPAHLAALISRVKTGG